MSLPQEIADQICSYLAPEDLKTAYYISTSFRQAAEEHAEKYRTREIEITHENKHNIMKNYRGFRLRYVKRILYQTRFPDLVVEEDSRCRETAEEVSEKDMIFTEQVTGLFATLKHTEEIAGIRNQGKYELGIYRPRQKVVGNVCFHREHDLWRVHLFEHESLPNLMSVSSFKLFEYEYDELRAKLDYRIVVDCIAHFPNVEKVAWNTGHDEWSPNHIDSPANKVLWDYDGPRRDTRHDFSKAVMLAKIPESLRTLRLIDFFCKDWDYGPSRMDEEVDQTKPMPNLVLPARKDPFSSSLRLLTYHLRTLILRVQVDDSLFWPKDGSSPVWPNLAFLSIMFHKVTPTGSWYFEGPRGEGHASTGYELGVNAYPPFEVTEDDEAEHCEFEEECPRAFESVYDFQYRVSPNNDVLGPFLESFARAATNMPKMVRAVLWSPLRWDISGLSSESGRYGYEDFEYFDPDELSAEHGKNEYDLAWGLAYTRPQYHTAFLADPGEINCEARQIWWAVRNWRPNPSLHALIQQIGHREHGDELREYWDDEIGRRTSRERFEDWMWPC
jgi:hypothetical protein